MCIRDSTIALIKPYKKACANYADILILSNLALLSFVPSNSALVSTVIPRILLLTPIVIFIVVSLVYVVSKLMRSIKVPSQQCHNCCQLRRASLNTGPTSTVGALAAAEALIQPTCNVISYGTHDA